jgi:hypothetical protein
LLILARFALALALAEPPSAAPAPAPALAPTQRPGRDRVRGIKLPATRIDDQAIVLDGRVDEPAWLTIPTLPPMIQVEPRYGAAPTHGTDVRVAYGDRGLYVAFDCYDDPQHVRGAFSRKDQLGPSDRVAIEIDPNNDETNGFRFVVNPSGAQEDAQVVLDDLVEVLWDGIWQAAARRNDHGWSAELLIPWATLRFDAAGSYTFGVNVERWSNEAGERQVLSPTPQGLPGRMSWALDYAPVTGIEPGLNVELRPFASARIAAQRPPDSLDRSWPLLPNGGFDVKYGLRGNLTLDLAVNPDFGQAEVDPAVLNLGPFEVFFPERRQFFLESKEIFETRFALFYSRRIGNNPRPQGAQLSERDVGDGVESGQLVSIDPLTRIFGATRITGMVAPGWRVGVLTATAGPTAGVERFSDGYERRVRVDPLTQFSVLRLRREYDSQTSVGAIVTAVNRGAGALQAFTGGFDYRLRFRERWRHGAQLIGTHDGQRSGVGASSDLRRSGRNLETWIGGELLTPNANFNDLGFMRFANYLNGWVGAAVFNAQPIGRIRGLRETVSVDLSNSFEGYNQGRQLNTSTSLTTERLWQFRLDVGGRLSHYDLYETRGGIPYLLPWHWWNVFNISTPNQRRLSATLRGAYGEQAGKPGPDIGLELRWRPVDRLDLLASFDLNTVLGRPRWTTTNALGEPVFARGTLLSYTGVLRGTLGILPTLTLQSFNQLYYATAHHTDFFILTAPEVLVATDPTPYAGIVDQALTSLISNSILRWEYRPGSFLFVAYTHRTSFSEGGMTVKFEPGRGFGNLVQTGAANEDIVFVKLVQLFSL